MGGSFARRQSSEGQLWRRQNIRKAVSCFFVHGEIVRRELSSGQSSEEQLSWGQLYGFNHPGSNFLCVRVCEYVRVCVWGGGGRGWGTFIRGTNFIGINYPWGKLSKGQYFGSQSSRGGQLPKWQLSGRQFSSGENV